MGASSGGGNNTGETVNNSCIQADFCDKFRMMNSDGMLCLPLYSEYLIPMAGIGVLPIR